MNTDLITNRNIGYCPVEVIVRFTLTDDSIYGGSSSFTTTSKKITLRINDQDDIDDGFGGGGGGGGNDNEDDVEDTDGVLKEYSFHNVYDESVENEQFYAEAVDPMINDLVNGANCSMILAGSEDCRIGKIVNNHLIVRLSHQLFEKILKKKEISSYKIRVSSYRIFNEKIGDLFYSMGSNLKTQNRKLYFRNDEFRGIRISPQNKWVDCKDSEQMVKLYGLSYSQRDQEFHQHWNFKISTRSVFVFEVDLEQVTNNGKLYSNFKIVEINGIERIGLNETVLKSKEGETINEYLISFNILVKTLISTPITEFVSYYRSTFTNMLKDVLGGNCYTRVVMYVNRQERNVELYNKILQLLSSMKMIRNFPLVNEDISLGLMSRQRSESNYYLNKGIIGGTGFGGIRGNKKLFDDRVLKMNMELLRITEAKTLVEKDYTNLKGHNIELIRKHHLLKENFKKSEKERVRLFDMLSKIESLLGSGSIMDNSGKGGRGEDNMLNLEKLLKRLNTEKEEKQQIMMEYVAMKKNFSKLNAKMKDMQMKNDQLNIEMLKLIKMNINSTKRRKLIEKEEFLKEINSLRRENELVVKENGALMIQAQSLRNSIEKLNIQLETSKIENQRIRLSKKEAKKDEEILSLKMSIRKQAFQQNQQKVLIEQLKTSEVKRNEEIENSRILIGELEEKHRLKLKEFVRKFEQLNILKERKEDKLRNIDENDGEIDDIEEIRKKEESELDRIRNNIRESIKHMNEDLVETYKNKETRLLKENKGVTEKLVQISGERSLLLEKYIDLKITFLSKLDSDEKLFDNLLISDEQLENLQKESGNFNKDNENEIYELRNMLNISEKTVLKLKEQHLESTEKHENSIMTLQKKYMDLLQEFSDLRNEYVEKKKVGKRDEEFSNHLEKIKEKMVEEMKNIKEIKNESEGSKEKMRLRITELEGEVEKHNETIENLKKDRDRMLEKLKAGVGNEKDLRRHKDHLEKHYRILKKKYMELDRRNQHNSKYKNDLENVKLENTQMKKENEFLQTVVKNKGNEKDSEIVGRYNLLKSEMMSQVNKLKTQCRLNEEQLKMMQDFVKKQQQRNNKEKGKQRRDHHRHQKYHKSNLIIDDGKERLNFGRNENRVNTQQSRPRGSNQRINTAVSTKSKRMNRVGSGSNKQISVGKQDSHLDQLSLGRNSIRESVRNERIGKNISSGRRSGRSNRSRRKNEFDVDEKLPIIDN